jgi:hypothetical protein
LGSITHGITLIDSQAISTKPQDYKRRLCDAITVADTTFASLATTRNDQCFATMWTDYRTDRRFPYDIENLQRFYECGKFPEMASFLENPLDGIRGTESEGSLPCLRCLDAALMHIAKDKYRRCCGWILSLSDGYDHPFDDREQIEISKAAAKICQQMAISISDFIQNMHRTSSETMNLSKEWMVDTMSNVGSNVLQDIRGNGILDYVGSGNVTVCVRPAASTCSPSLPDNSNIHNRRSSFVIDTLSVGDCLAFIYDPSVQVTDETTMMGSGIKILPIQSNFSLIQIQSLEQKIINLFLSRSC